MEAKKPWYKRWKVWGYAFGVMFLLSAALELSGYNAKQEAIQAEEAAVAAEEAEKKAAEKKAAAAEAKRKEDVKAKADAEAKAVEDAKAEADRAEADVGIRESLKSVVELSNGVILDIKPSPYGKGDWATMWVVVSDAWYESPEHEKERFAETIGDAVRFATNGEAMLVHFYDAYDKELASEKAFGGYKIKR